MMGSPGFPAVRPKATGCRALASHGALQRDWKIFTVSLHLIGFDRVQYPSHVVHGFPWFLLKLRFCGYPGYPPFFRHIRCTPQSCWSSSSARQMFHSLRRWDSEISCVVRTEFWFGRYSMCIYIIYIIYNIYMYIYIVPYPRKSLKLSNLESSMQEHL